MPNRANGRAGSTLVRLMQTEQMLETSTDFRRGYDAMTAGRSRPGSNINIPTFVHRNQVTSYHGHVNNMSRNQLLDMLVARGISSNDINQHINARNNNSRNHSEFPTLIQRIRFNLNSIGFNNADVLNLESSSYQFVESMDLLIAGMISIATSLVLTTEETNFVHQ